MDPDRLHEAVQALMRTRTALIEACDRADAASNDAGTPLRTQSLRAHIDAVTTEIRFIDSKITETAASERVEHQSTVGNVTKTLALQSSDTLNSVTVGRSSRQIGTNLEARNSSTRVQNANRSGEPIQSVHLSSAGDHQNDVDDEQPESIPLFLLTAKSLMVPRTQVRTKRTFYELPSLASSIRKLLKDGGFGTDRITNGELKEIVELFKLADPAWLNQCIFDLSDKELKLIADDMDSSGFGNYNGLSSKEKEAFIANLATKLDAKQFARICAAFNDPKQIASVLAVTKNCWLAKQGFLTYCKNVFDSRNRTANFSAADSELAAAAQVIASLSTAQLSTVLSEQADSLEFLRGIFRLAQGQMLIPSTSGRLDCAFDPKLIQTINQLALGLPPRSAERFLVFRLTVESLVNMKAANPAPEVGFLELLKKAIQLLGSNPLTILADHKADRFLFTDFFILLAQSDQMSVCTSMINSLRGTMSQGDAMMVGYVIALIENAEQAISNQREHRIKLAYGFAFALINAFEPWVVVAGSAGFSLLEFVTSNIDNGLSVSATTFAAMVNRFNNMGNLLVWITSGRDLAENRGR